MVVEADDLFERLRVLATEEKERAGEDVVLIVKMISDCGMKRGVGK